MAELMTQDPDVEIPATPDDVPNPGDEPEEPDPEPEDPGEVTEPLTMPH